MRDSNPFVVCVCVRIVYRSAPSWYGLLKRFDPVVASKAPHRDCESTLTLPMVLIIYVFILFNFWYVIIKESKPYKIVSSWSNNLKMIVLCDWISSLLIGLRQSGAHCSLGLKELIVQEQKAMLPKCFWAALMMKSFENWNIFFLA